MKRCATVTLFNYMSHYQIDPETIMTTHATSSITISVAVRSVNTIVNTMNIPKKQPIRIDMNSESRVLLAS